MKDFSKWMLDLTNSIEDASIIHKDEKGNIITPMPSYIVCKNCGANALEGIDGPYYDFDY